MIGKWINYTLTCLFFGTIGALSDGPDGFIWGAALGWAITFLYFQAGDDG